MDSTDVPSDISFQLWYLDDGTSAGIKSAVTELLKLFCTHGPSFGIAFNVKFLAYNRDSTFQDFLLRFAIPYRFLTVWSCLVLLFLEVHNILMILLRSL